MDFEVEEVVGMQDDVAGNVDDISNSISCLFLDVWSCNDDLIAYEILSRLNVKELMRFKSVSKRYQWLIENDPHFIKLHLTQSEKRPLFFYIIPLDNYWRAQKEGIRYRGYDELLLTTDLSYQGRCENTVQIRSFRKTNLFCCDQFSASLNGLICFFDQYEHYSVCIYNVSTREATPWIKSTVLTEEQEKHPGFDISGTRICSFGFDPTTMEHKVICIWSIYMEDCDGNSDDDDINDVCEVLTVGENTWRRIDQVPPCFGNNRQESACVNGSIYWMTDYLAHGDWKKDLEHIVAFDIGNEKFRTISLPFCIVDKRLNPNRYVYALDRIFVLEVGGRLAFLRRINAEFVKIRIFNDECSLYNREMGNKITISAEEKSWTEDTVKLPFNWDRDDHYVEFYAVPGTDQIIMETYDCSSRYMNSVSLYSYSCTKKSLMEIKVNGIPSSIPEGCPTRLFVPFVESVVPVRKKITRTTELHSDPIQT